MYYSKLSIFLKDTRLRVMLFGNTFIMLAQASIFCKSKLKTNNILPFADELGDYRVRGNDWHWVCCLTEQHYACASMTMCETT